MKSDARVHIGVIGCGRWGPNHIRVFNSFPESTVRVCSDLDTERLYQMRTLYPHTRTTTEYMEILDDAAVDAVVIATPTETHHKLVGEALRKGKDVLVEKPVANTIARAQALASLAARKRRILMVGHTFLFNSGIRKLRDYLRAGKLGRIYYLNAVRTNLGPIRSDVSSIWDLASHDVSIFNFLLEARPSTVSARGEGFIRRGLEDVAFVTLTYPKRVLVNIHVSWLNPRKVREITVVGEKMMMMWDDMDNVGPIRIYDKKVERAQYYDSFGEFQLRIREGDLTIPKFAMAEPLKTQSKHFLECLRTRANSISDGRFSVDVVRTLAAIEQSIRRGGVPVRIRAAASRSTRKRTSRSR